MNNKIVVPLSEIRELSFEYDNLDVVESIARYLKYPFDPDHGIYRDHYERQCSGKVEYSCEYNEIKLIAKYEWDTSNDSEKSYNESLDLSVESYDMKIIDCNFSIMDGDEIEDVKDETLQNEASGFESFDSELVSLIEAMESR